MLLQIFEYTKKNGWSMPFPDLDSENTLILVFAAPAYLNNFTPIEELSAHYKTSKIIGCSSSGEINNNKISDNSISGAIAKFEKSQIRVVASPIAEASESYEVGKSLSKELMRNDLQSIFVLSEGLKVNGSELVR